MTSRDFQAAHERYKRQTRGGYQVELVNFGGTYKAGNGYVWARKIGFASTGGTVTRSPKQKFRYRAGNNLYWGVGRKYWVQTGFDGVDEIVHNVNADLEQASISIAQLNVAEPARQFTVLESVSNLNAFANGNDTIRVFPSVYRRPNGTYGAFTGDIALDLLTAHLPSESDVQVVVCVWLDPYSNTLSTVASSEISQSIDLTLPTNLAQGLVLINECHESAPDGAIGVYSFIVYGDDIAISESNKYLDLRGMIGSGAKPTHYEPMVFDDEILFFDGDVLMFEAG